MCDLAHNTVILDKVTGYHANTLNQGFFPYYDILNHKSQTIVEFFTYPFDG